MTHIDAHMGAALVLRSSAAPTSARASTIGLPVLLTADIAGYAPEQPPGRGRPVDVRPVRRTRRARPACRCVDRVLETNWRSHRSASPVLRAVDRGRAREPLTFICLHPNAPGELEFIEPTSSYIRTDEYDLFGSARLSGVALRARRFARSGIRVVAQPAAQRGLIIARSAGPACR